MLSPFRRPYLFLSSTVWKFSSASSNTTIGACTIGPRCLTSVSGDGGQERARWAWLLKGGSTLAVLGAGIFGLYLQGNRVCLAEAAPESRADASSSASDLQQLRSWLVANGADLGALEIKESKSPEGLDCGYGLFVAEGKAGKSAGTKKGWWPFGGATAPLAYFPWSMAITAENILKDPVLGRGYGWMVGQGFVDERTVIVSYLALHRAKGEASPLQPWIKALPRRFDTPMYFSQDELEELRGTNLYRAANARRTALAEKWEKIEPSICAIATHSPASTPSTSGSPKGPTFDDYLWAESVFWSRGCGVPMPLKGNDGETVATSSKAQVYHVVDAIVPGLDFANHHTTSPHCWWEIVAPAQQSAKTAESTIAKDAPMMQIHLKKGVKAKPGQEVMISYGDKSNEELLMLYGFAAQGNPNDTVSLLLPIPPSSMWDDIMHARMRLMRTLGLHPQLFLSLSSLPSSSSVKSKRRFSSVIPEQALDTLEIFVLDFKELNARMRLAQSLLGDEGQDDGDLDQKMKDAAPSEGKVPLLDMNQIDQQKSKMSEHELQTHYRRLGLRMASLTSLTRLLEVHVVSLEGEEGTGSLEDDEALLSQGPNSMTQRKWASIVYRSGQKRITREYLKHARSETQDVIQLMSELEDLRKGNK